jgi:hypothetical protein
LYQRLSPLPRWLEGDNALSSPEGAKEETAMPSKILFTSTSAEIVEDAREMSPAGLERDMTIRQ